MEDYRVYLECDRCGPLVERVGLGEVGVFSRRHPGKSGRPNEAAEANQDGALVAVHGSGAVLLAVADGCGGLPAGAQAAAVALRALYEAIESSDAPVTGMLDGFDAANRAVLALGTGAGTTLVAAIIDGTTFRTAHVGDSLTLVTGQRGRVRYRAISHSPTGYAVEAGILDENDALHHEDRSYVSNVVGSDAMRVDIGPAVGLRPRDTVLLASDGLTDNLYADEIVNLVRTGPLARSIERLADAAESRMLDTGGDAPSKPDDLTLIAYRPTA